MAGVAIEVKETDEENNKSNENKSGPCKGNTCILLNADRSVTLHTTDSSALEINTIPTEIKSQHAKSILTQQTLDPDLRPD